MENFQIPSNNPFDDRAREFIRSQKGQDLQRRYGVEPYEEENKIFDTISWIGSYFCNGVSILTASTWLFSYSYSIFMELPNPKIIAGFITFTLLLGLEFIQRYFTTKYLKRYYHLKLIKDGMRLYGSSLYGLLAGMCICACISIGASFFGGFDFVKTVTSVPVYEAPTLLDVTVIENRYQKQIDDAQKNVTDYASKRVWKNRLSSQDAKKYQDLLDKKLALVDEMFIQVKKADSENKKAIALAKENHESAVLAHEEKTSTQGGGLGVLAIVFISLFYLCMWYREYFKFRTVSQYAVMVTSPVKPVINIPPTPPMIHDGGGVSSQSQDLTLMVATLAQEMKALRQAQTNASDTDNNVHSNQSGVHSTFNENTIPSTQGAQTSVYTATQPCTWAIPEHLVSVIDKYTVPHRSFKTGELVHMNYGQIKNRIDDYAKRVEDAKAKDDMVALANRESKLLYWNERMRELLAKADMPQAAKEGRG